MPSAGPSCPLADAPTARRDLPSVPNVSILNAGRAANASTPAAPCGARPPRITWKCFTVLRPVGTSPPTGRPRLEVHEMNRHSRENGGKPSCRHVPEEVFHGAPPFGRRAPRPSSNGSPLPCPCRGGRPPDRTPAIAAFPSASAPDQPPGTPILRYPDSSPLRNAASCGATAFGGSCGPDPDHSVDVPNTADSLDKQTA